MMAESAAFIRFVAHVAYWAMVSGDTGHIGGEHRRI